MEVEIPEEIPEEKCIAKFYVDFDAVKLAEFMSLRTCISRGRKKEMPINELFRVIYKFGKDRLLEQLKIEYELEEQQKLDAELASKI